MVKIYLFIVLLFPCHFAVQEKTVKNTNVFLTLLMSFTPFEARPN